MSDTSINTTHADESGPDNSDSLRTGIIILTIATALALPVMSLFVLITWISFSWLKIKRSALLFFLGIYSIILLIVSIFINVFSLFITAWTENLPNLLANTDNNPTGQIMGIILQQAPLSVIIGSTIGLLYASWFWKRKKAKWEDVNFRLTPWELYRKRKNINDIRDDKNGPLNGVTLGISEKTGERVTQTDGEAEAHTFYAGASGSGKTTTLMMTARDIIKREHGLIFVDLKGDPKLAHTLKEFSDRYGRTFRHWSMQSVREPYTGPSELGPAFYDPIARGEASRRKNLLMAVKKWSEPYYESLAEEYLQKAFTILIGNPNPNISTLEDISSLLNPKELLKRSEKLLHDPKYREVVEDIGRMNDEKTSIAELSAIGSLRVDMKNLAYNVIGPWLKKDPQKLNDINIKDVAHSGEIVLFSLDSSNYSKESSVLGNLIIQDLKTVSSELRADPADRPLHVIIDEFSAIGSDNIIQLINKSRDAGIPVSLSTQSLGDLKKVDDTFLDQLLGIVNTFCIHRPNTKDDAEIFAGLTGGVTRSKVKKGVEYTKNIFGLAKGYASGSGSVEDVEENNIIASEFQKLETGELIYISKSPHRLIKVTVIPEREGLSTPDRKMPPIQINLDQKPAPTYNEYIEPPELPLYEESEVITRQPSSTTLEPTSLNEIVSVGEEKIIVTKKSDPARLEKIFNRPVSDFIDESRQSDYAKHYMPPQKVIPSASKNVNVAPNLSPPIIPVFKRENTVLPPRINSTLNIENKVETPTEEKAKEEKPSGVFPPKDKFDF